MNLLTSSKRQLPFLFFAFVTQAAVLWAGDLKPEDIVARHLDSIGTAQARQGLKSRVIQGGATYRVIQGGYGAIDGKYVFASEGQKSNFLFKINASSYRGEQFICDGNKVAVAATWSDKTHSEFGEFVLSQDVLVKDNLLGGVWSSGWPLLDIEGRKPKLHFEGTKKIDGKELLAIRYQPKKSGDVDIKMYFDPQTFRHVMTVYSVEPGRSVAGGELGQAEKMQKRYSLDERFSDFQAVDGLTLPTHYKLRYSLETEAGETKIIEWEVQARAITNNLSVDPRSFQLK